MGAVLLLDHRGQPITREKPRQIRAKYDVAQTSRNNENHWGQTDGLSAAAANSPSVRKVLRERARYEVANNSYASGMIRTLANDVVGAGPQLQLDSGDKDADKAGELAFWSWWQADRLTEKMWTIVMSLATDGETFPLFITNFGLRHPVKLGLKTYEAEQVARPYVDLTDPMLSDGIIYDDFGNPVAYTVLRRHPGDTGAMGLPGEYDIIPATEMVHLYRVERPGQTRGIPEILPALPLYAQLRRFTLAVLDAAETAADLAGVIRSTATVTDPDDVEPLDAIDIERRMFLTMPRGWDINQLKAEQPATTYEMFKRQIIQEIARCLSMPYNVAAGDSSGMNYSSGRLDHMNYARSIRTRRYSLETNLLSPMFGRWWQEARLVDGVLPESMRALNDPPKHEWRWEGSEHQDPAKEANGQETRLASHTTTLAREYSRLGLDWEDELRQRAKEVALMKSLGLTVEQSAEQPEPDEEETDDEE